MSAKRMLGTDWSSSPVKAARGSRCCNHCEPRQPTESSAAKYNCSRPTCNGTRKPGEYGYTWCPTGKRHYNLCGRCHKAIEPEWHLSLNVRAQLFEQGIHLKDVLMLNEQAGENAD